MAAKTKVAVTKPPKAKPGAKPKPKAGAKPKPKAGAKPKPKAGAKPEPKAGAKPRPKAGAKAGAKPKSARSAKVASPARAARSTRASRPADAPRAARPASGSRPEPRPPTRRPTPAPPAHAASDDLPGSAPVEPLDPDPGDDSPAARDISRLLRYGERFGTDKIDVRMLPLQLHSGSGLLAVCDPAVPDTWHVLDRPIGSGAFRVMLSVARPDSADEAARGPGGGAAHERLAAVVIHVGRPPIARWTVAHFRGLPTPEPADALPRTAATTGWLVLLDAGDGSPGVVALPPITGVTPIELPLTDGRRALALPGGTGAFAAYWALDAADKPICLVIDLDVFTARAWKVRPAARAT